MENYFCKHLLNMKNISKHSATILLIFFLSSCGNSLAKKDMPEYDYLLTTEYNNEYNADKLVKVTIIRSEAYKNSNKLFYVSKYEHIYEYIGNKLVKINEFEIDVEGNKTLQYTVNYVGNSEEKIGWNNSDTISYEKRQYDSEERLIGHIKRTNISVYEFDFEIADNFEERMVYDEKGNLIERNITDYFFGKSRKELIFYNKTDLLSNSIDLDIIYYQTTEHGDTTKTERYYNGEFETIVLEIKDNKTIKELTYTADNTLIFSQETIDLGNETIEVTEFPEHNSIDSVFCIKEKEVKSVSISSGQKRTTFTEYDKYGNQLVEKTYTLFYKKDL